MIYKKNNKLFACDKCNLQYTHKSSLSRHIKKCGITVNNEIKYEFEIQHLKNQLEIQQLKHELEITKNNLANLRRQLLQLTNLMLSIMFLNNPLMN
jgi:hypothetical protein